MRALTLHQPWASLVALGYKTIETRSWSTSYRGPLAIHAAKDERPSRTWAAHNSARPMLQEEWDAMPFGAVVATCELVDVLPIVDGHDWSALAANRRDCVVATYYPLRDGANRTLSAVRSGQPVDCTGQLPYGDFAPGRFAWVLADVLALSPRCARGRQGLWTWSPVAA